MAAKTSSVAMPDSYFALVREFPLTRIKNDAHLRVAQEMIERLLKQAQDEGAEEYLDALTDLVEVYEEEHVEIPDASEADVLRELMAANRLSQSRLAKEVGISQSTISAILSGARGLTKAQ